ncbi:MAG: hypothetical protein HYX68_04470 [Planctomycetes bacterium]|nr:hypothetical protein [Planctomycetota bacterium]
MVTQQYRQNRARFSHADLAKYQGMWIAFSSDGSRIVASAETVDALEDQLAACGQNAQQVVLEWLAGPDDDIMLGAGESM